VRGAPSPTTRRSDAASGQGAGGDVNGDGYADVAYGFGDCIGVYHGSARGLLGPPSSGRPPSCEANVANLVSVSVGGLGDVNGDGRADVGTIVMKDEDLNEYWSVGVELGGSHSREGLSIANPGLSFVDQTLGGDVDGDGRDEIVVSGGPALLLYRGAWRHLPLPSECSATIGL
jgi:hypothetical protein